MTRDDLLVLVGRRLRDTSHSLYSKELIYDGIRLGIDRIKQEVAALRGMPYITDGSTEIAYLPEQYHTMLADMAVKHSFAMDERTYESNLAMNEFEGKLEGLRQEVESGSLVIKDEEGEEVLVPTDTAVGKMNLIYYSEDNYDTTADSNQAQDYRQAYNSTADGCGVTG